MPGYAIETGTSRWLTADVNGDGKTDLVHVRDAGIDTLLSLGNGTYALVREGWKPRPAYGMNPTGTQWIERRRQPGRPRRPAARLAGRDQHPALDR